jgi:hypothetical protein
MRIKEIVCKTKGGTSEDKEALIREWLKDKDVRERLQRTFSIRKKGYAESTSFVDKEDTAPELLANEAGDPVPPI